MPPAEASRAQLYELITGDDEGRVCRDIPESACREQPGNFLRHVASLSATKAGDGLADPKIVLPWLLATLGAPAWTIGLLVPLREGGALVPQLFVAGAIRRQPVRKWLWAAGSVVQGVCVAGMAASALTLTGPAAGLAIAALMLLFALARSVCSVCYKDVLGKTVMRANRGTATGTATSLGAALVLAYGGLLAVGWIERSVATVSAALLLAGGLWLAAAWLFTRLHEEPGATAGGGNAWHTTLEQFGLLGEDPQLVRFIAVRALLVSLALAPPYLLLLGGSEPGNLGNLVLATALAALLSGHAWGRLSDLSSRRVLIRAGLIGGAVLAFSAVLGSTVSGTALHGLILPVVVFVTMICYQGVRIGRATHLVDMAGSEQRASYTALANTAIGLFLVLATGLGWVAHVLGAPALLAVLAIMALAGGALATGLREVQ